MQRFILLLAGAAFALSLAGSASATPETGYTLDTPPPELAFTAGGATGAILPVTVQQNDFWSICLAGVCDIPNQDWLVFQVRVDTGAVNDIGISALFQAAVGVGYFKEGVPPANYVGSMANPSAPNILFPGGLTGTSLPLFVAFPDGTLPTAAGAFGEGATQFMVAESGGAGLQSVIGNFTTPIQIIPEPSTALLFGAGLVLLGLKRRS